MTIIVRPGDTVLLPFDTEQGPNARDHAREVLQGLAEVIPGVSVSMVEGLREAAVYRPAPAMPTDEDVEAAAERAHRSDWPRYAGQPRWESLDDDSRQDWRRIARAVLGG